MWSETEKRQAPPNSQGKLAMNVLEIHEGDSLTHGLTRNEDGPNNTDQPQVAHHGNFTT